LLAVVSLGQPALADVAAPENESCLVAPTSALSGGDDVVDLYRAVGVREFDSVTSSGKFLPGANSLEGRQFALTLDEAIAYADTDLNKVAVLRATVDAPAVSALDFSTTIDPFIFRNGVITVQPGVQSDIFHAGLRRIDHVL
jgi:filamentous hemagglutinin